MSLYELVGDLLPESGSIATQKTNTACLNSPQDSSPITLKKVDECRADTEPKTKVAEASPAKAKIYLALVDGKEITLIDTHRKLYNEFAAGVKARFGADRVTGIKEK